MRKEITLARKSTDEPFGMTMLFYAESQSLVVDSVAPNSPAESVGLRNKDVILSVNGERVSQSQPPNVAGVFGVARELALEIEREAPEPDTSVNEAVLESMIPAPEVAAVHSAPAVPVEDAATSAQSLGMLADLAEAAESAIPSTRAAEICSVPSASVVETVLPLADALVPAPPAPPVSSSKRRVVEVINLISDDEDDAPNPPNASSSASSGTRPGGVKEEEEDCVLIEPSAKRSKTVEVSASGSGGMDDDIEFVGGTFESVCAMPHQREACSSFAFAQNFASATNAKHCAYCYCYICESKASECLLWSTHCHASYKRDDSRREKAVFASPLFRNSPKKHISDFWTCYKEDVVNLSRSVYNRPMAMHVVGKMLKRVTDILALADLVFDHVMVEAAMLLMLVVKSGADGGAGLVTQAHSHLLELFLSSACPPSLRVSIVNDIDNHRANLLSVPREPHVEAMRLFVRHDSALPWLASDAELPPALLSGLMRESVSPLLAILRKQNKLPATLSIQKHFSVSNANDPVVAITTQLQADAIQFGDLSSIMARLNPSELIGLKVWFGSISTTVSLHVAVKAICLLYVAASKFNVNWSDVVCALMLKLSNASTSGFVWSTTEADDAYKFATNAIRNPTVTIGASLSERELLHLGIAIGTAHFDCFRRPSNAEYFLSFIRANFNSESSKLIPLIFEYLRTINQSANVASNATNLYSEIMMKGYFFTDSVLMLYLSSLFDELVLSNTRAGISFLVNHRSLFSALKAAYPSTSSRSPEIEEKVFNWLWTVGTELTHPNWLFITELRDFLIFWNGTDYRKSLRPGSKAIVLLRLVELLDLSEIMRSVYASSKKRKFSSEQSVYQPLKEWKDRIQSDASTSAVWKSYQRIALDLLELSDLTRLILDSYNTTKRDMYPDDDDDDDSDDDDEFYQRVMDYHNPLICFSEWPSIKKFINMSECSGALLSMLVQTDSTNLERLMSVGMVDDLLPYAQEGLLDVALKLHSIELLQKLLGSNHVTREVVLSKFDKWANEKVIANPRNHSHSVQRFAIAAAASLESTTTTAILSCIDLRCAKNGVTGELIACLFQHLPSLTGFCAIFECIRESFIQTYFNYKDPELKCVHAFVEKCVALTGASESDTAALEELRVYVERSIPSIESFFKKCDDSKRESVIQWLKAAAMHRDMLTPVDYIHICLLFRDTNRASQSVLEFLMELVDSKDDFYELSFSHILEWLKTHHQFSLTLLSQCLIVFRSKCTQDGLIDSTVASLWEFMSPLSGSFWVDLIASKSDADKDGSPFSLLHTVVLLLLLCDPTAIERDPNVDKWRAFTSRDENTASNCTHLDVFFEILLSGDAEEGLLQAVFDVVSASFFKLKRSLKLFDAFTKALRGPATLVRSSRSNFDLTFEFCLGWLLQLPNLHSSSSLTAIASPEMEMIGRLIASLGDIASTVSSPAGMSVVRATLALASNFSLDTVKNALELLQSDEIVGEESLVGVLKGCLTNQRRCPGSPELKVSRFRVAAELISTHPSLTSPIFTKDVLVRFLTCDVGVLIADDDFSDNYSRYVALPHIIVLSPGKATSSATVSIVESLSSICLDYPSPLVLECLADFIRLVLCAKSVFDENTVIAQLLLLSPLINVLQDKLNRKDLQFLFDLCTKDDGSLSGIREIYPSAPEYFADDVLSIMRNKINAKRVNIEFMFREITALPAIDESDSSSLAYKNLLMEIVGLLVTHDKTRSWQFLLTVPLIQLVQWVLHRSTNLIKLYTSDLRDEALFSDSSFLYHIWYAIVQTDNEEDIAAVCSVGKRALASIQRLSAVSAVRKTEFTCFLRVLRKVLLSNEQSKHNWKDVFDFILEQLWPVKKTTHAFVIKELGRKGDKFT